MYYSRFLTEKIILARNIFIGRVYLLGAFIYWAAFIYSVRLCNKYVAQLDKTTLLDFPSTPHPLVKITHQSPPLDPCCSNLEGSARLNRRVSGLTLLQQHHPNLTCPKNNLVVLTSRPPPRAIFPQGFLLPSLPFLSSMILESFHIRRHHEPEA